MSAVLVRTALALALAFVVVACIGAAAQTFTLDPDRVHTVSVYAAGPSAGPDLAEALLAEDRPDGAAARLHLTNADRRTVVDLIAWEENGPPTDWQPPYFPNAEAYWRRDFRLATSFAQEGEDFAVSVGDPVQWSEFLMRDLSRRAELSDVVTALTESMTFGEPATLLSIQQLLSDNGLSIGLFGRWSEPAGFKVFTEGATFGSRPYWAPMADNAHWMLEVVAIR